LSQLHTQDYLYGTKLGDEDIVIHYIDITVVSYKDSENVGYNVEN